MEHNFLHIFRLTVEGLAEPVEFRMFHDLDDVMEVTDGFAKYVARQEDDFLPVGSKAAVRASKVVYIEHLRFEKTAKT
jgi:hypothetical protein